MRNEIESRLADGFERRLFQAALNNLADHANPLRFNNFAYATRELIRHVLSRHAPDDEVRACSWYADETGKDDGISRRQRVFYAVQGGLTDEYVASILGLDVPAVHKTLRDALDNLSKHTHIEEATFAIGEQVVDQFVDDSLTAVVEFFRAIETNRNSLISALWEQIDKSVIDAALYRTILSIDELASHHSIEEVYTDKVSIVGIDSCFIRFEAKGTIACELQWGSNGDLRRGDGAVMDQSFPFSCELWSPVDDPNAIQTDEDAVGVDTNSWYEGLYDE